MFRRILPIALVLLCVPTAAFAATTTWNFKGQTKIDGWNHGNLTTMELLPGGLLVRTDTAGQLVKVSDLRRKTDTVTVFYEAAHASDGIFLWRPKGKGNDNIYQIPISFASGKQKLVLDMSRIPQWGAESDRIGFGFNPGTSLVIEKIEFSTPSLLNRIRYGAQAFWVFDQLRPYSVNFLWGPLLATSEDQAKNLFSQVPPLGPSANPVLYGLIGMALIAYAVLLKTRGTYATGTRRAANAIIIVAACCWILYDVRMGMEFVRYAQKDVRTWWTQPIELKDFRDRGSFNAFMEAAVPFVSGEKKFVFATSRGWPYSGQMRYRAYPSLPLASDAVDVPEATYWLVYDRKDIAVNAEGRLALNGEPFTEPGNVLLDFEPGAFVFHIAAKHPNPDSPLPTP